MADIRDDLLAAVEMWKARAEEAERQRDTLNTDLSEARAALESQSRTFDATWRDLAEARAEVEGLKDRDYAPLKQWIAEHAPEAAREAYDLMVKAEATLDVLRRAVEETLYETEECLADPNLHERFRDACTLHKQDLERFLAILNPQEGR